MSGMSKSTPSKIRVTEFKKMMAAVAWSSSIKKLSPGGVLLKFLQNSKVTTCAVGLQNYQEGTPGQLLTCEL